jgi:hypothetical protein
MYLPFLSPPPSCYEVVPFAALNQHAQQLSLLEQTNRELQQKLDHMYAKEQWYMYEHVRLSAELEKERKKSDTVPTKTRQISHRHHPYSDQPHKASPTSTPRGPCLPVTQALTRTDKYWWSHETNRISWGQPPSIPLDPLLDLIPLSIPENVHSLLIVTDDWTCVVEAENKDWSLLIQWSREWSDVIHLVKHVNDNCQYTLDLVFRAEEPSTPSDPYPSMPELMCVIGRVIEVNLHKGPLRRKREAKKRVLLDQQQQGKKEPGIRCLSTIRCKNQLTGETFTLHKQWLLPPRPEQLPPFALVG